MLRADEGGARRITLIGGALADLGLRVPDQVQVVGFDNDEEGGHLVPRPTTIDPGNDSMATHVMGLLLSRVEGSRARSGDAREVVATACLVTRESTRLGVRR